MSVRVILKAGIDMGKALPNRVIIYKDADAARANKETDMIEVSHGDNVIALVDIRSIVAVEIGEVSRETWIK